MTMNTYILVSSLPVVSLVIPSTWFTCKIILTLSYQRHSANDGQSDFNFEPKIVEQEDKKLLMDILIRNVFSYIIDELDLVRGVMFFN